MERALKKLEPKKFYSYYDQQLRRCPPVEKIAAFGMSGSRATFGNSNDDQKALRFFCSLEKEFNIEGTPDWMIVDLTMQRIGSQYNEMSSGEMLVSRYSRYHSYDKNDIAFLSRCADQDLSTKWLLNQSENILNKLQQEEQMQARQSQSISSPKSRK